MTVITLSLVGYNFICIISVLHSMFVLLQDNFSFCSVYFCFSGNYIHDFDVAKARNFATGTNALQINNVTSKDGCAKLCIDNSGSGCQGFVFCQTSGVCTIIGVSPKQNQGSITADPKCDLYSRTSLVS